MTDDIDYYVIQADGKEEYQCKHCDTKYGSQKSIKTHVTIKHKVEKSGKKPHADGKGALPASPELVNGSPVTPEPTSAGFNFEDVPMSTQIPPDEPAIKSKTTEEILEEYESVELDESSASGEVIPDDTVDKIIAGLDEKDSTKNTEGEENVEGDTSLLEAENKSMKDTIKILTGKLEESEENSLKAQL